MIWIAPSEKDTDNAALEMRLWDAADQFRANSGLKSRGAEARFDYLLNRPEAENIGAKVNAAMRDIEKHNPQLAGVLPLTDETGRLCRLNLAVHGLEGEIKHGGNIHSYYDDPHDATGRFDFVLANPPFSVNAVDKKPLKDQVGSNRRFAFGLPRTDNANYLWIQLFHSALNEKGRAGFVMANSASDARSSEQELRRQLIESRAVDVMVAVGPKHDELVLHHLLDFNFTNLRGAAAQPFISNTALAGIELPLPGDAVAEKFCSLVKPLRLQQVTFERQIQNLRRTRDLLLPRLLPGQVNLTTKENYANA